MKWNVLRRFFVKASRAEIIERLAAAWLVRLDNGASAIDQASLDRFLTDNARHHAAFVRLSVVWSRFDALKNLAPIDRSVDPDLLAPAPEYRRASQQL